MGAGLSGPPPRGSRPGGADRAWYRARQFWQALAAGWAPAGTPHNHPALDRLPAEARALFEAMDRGDQRHALAVLDDLTEEAQGRRAEVPEALAQAALLHDCAKRCGPIRLRHRVAIVLLAAVQPARLEALWGDPEPAPSSRRYPYWVHRHHAALGAELARAAGCLPMAVELIAWHQRSAGGESSDAEATRLLGLLRAADDDN